MMRINKFEKTINKFVFIFPSFLIVTLFITYPFLSGLNLAFSDWNGMSKNIHYIGLDNFKEIFTDSVFYLALKNTIIFTVLVTVIQHIISLSIAVFIDKQMKGAEFYKTILFIPALLSTVIIGLVFSTILSPINGTLNSFLAAIGFDSLSNTDWLGNPNISLYAVIFTNIWQYIGYSMVIYLAGLQAVSSEIIEASKIDGANSWQVFRHIEFPSIAPSFTINTVLSVVGCLKAFEIIFVMTGGGPGNATELIGTYIYNRGFTGSRFGYGTAVSLVLFIFIVAVSFIQVKVLRRREESL